jgi:hypothetical protein
MSWEPEKTPELQTKRMLVITSRFSEMTVASEEERSTAPVTVEWHCSSVALEVLQ